MRACRKKGDVTCKSQLAGRKLNAIKKYTVLRVTGIRLDSWS
jgi:hypothetical protein